jgi:hypothetical protein
VIRLDQLPRPIDEAFIDAVAENRVDTYVHRYLTYVELRVDPDGAVREADVRSFCGTGRPREPMLTPYQP